MPDLTNTNERRADFGDLAVRTVASQTGVDKDTIDTAVRDAVAYIAHFCDRYGLDPHETITAGLTSYGGDFEDGDGAERIADGSTTILNTTAPLGA